MRGIRVLVMKVAWYEKLFSSLYYLSAKMELDGKPSLFSAWFLLAGFQTVNVVTAIFLYVALTGHAVRPSASLLLAITAVIFAANYYYISRKSWPTPKENEFSRRGRMGLSYIVISAGACLAAMSGLFLLVASRAP